MHHVILQNPAKASSLGPSRGKPRRFLFAEMGTGSGRLIIKGRFQPKQVENVLHRYIGALNSNIVYISSSAALISSKVEYVTCKTCKSLDTVLMKKNRIFFMSCESCGSR
jgi:translation initiation factor 2 subunit 2